MPLEQQSPLHVGSLVVAAGGLAQEIVPALTEARHDLVRQRVGEAKGHKVSRTGNLKVRQVPARVIAG
jgi:hypothetical protein